MRSLTKRFRICSPRSPFANRARPRVEELESRLVPYAVSGNSWVHPELVTISFVPDGTDLGGVYSNLFATLNARYSQSYWQNQFLKAAQVWAKETNLNFALVADYGSPIGNGTYQQGSPSFGDIRIGGYNFGSSTLAAAYLPPQVNNFSIAGDIQFNTGQSWVIGTTGGYDLFTVAMHEIGHALGLHHSGDYYAALYPSYVGARAGLGSDDVNGIRAVYSSSQARTHDSYDTGGGNGAHSTATLIDALISPSTLTALISNRDITTSADVDYYRFSVPNGTNGTMTVKLQSSGLSQLEPYLMIYNASETAIAYTDTTGVYGTTLTITITGVQAGQTYFVRAGGDDSSSPFGTGKYALTLNFGSNPSPTVPLPNTLTANGTPLSSGGATPQVPGSGHDDHQDHDHGDGCCCPFCGGPVAPSGDSPASEVANLTLADATLITVLDSALRPDARAESTGEPGAALPPVGAVPLFVPAEDIALTEAAPALANEETASTAWEDACDACFAEDFWLADREEVSV